MSIRSVLTAKWQVIKFNIVGVLNTLVDISVFSLLTHLFTLAVLPANAISYSCGLLNSYIWNKRWTFKQTNSIGQNVSREIFSFLIVNIITFGLNTGLIQLCTNFIGLSAWLSKIIATIITLAANYIGYSRLVFRPSK